MSSGIPEKCPKCGSDHLEKERYPNGAQTGDWICSNCEETGWIPTGSIDKPADKK